MKTLYLLLLLPIISYADVYSDAHNICFHIVDYGVAKQCHADFDNKQLNIAIKSFFYNDDICNEISDLININTNEFEHKNWHINITTETKSSQCTL